jgi:hypothetical protein
MAAHAEGEGASAPSLPMCRQCGRRPQWTVNHRGQIVVVSEFCSEHANIPMFDLPVESLKKPKQKLRGITTNERDADGIKKRARLSAFNAEVRRRRLKREGTR